MIIHLGGGVRGVGDDLPYFHAIINAVNERGDTIATNWVEASSTHKADPRVKMDWQDIVTRNIESMNAADLYIAEVTSYRLYHGYEIATMLQQGKPVLLLSRKPFQDFAISGLQNELLEMREYESESSLKKIVNNFLNKYSQLTTTITVTLDPRIAYFVEEKEKTTNQFKEQIVKDLIIKGMLSERFE